MIPLFCRDNLPVRVPLNRPERTVVLVEEREFSDDQDVTITDPDQSLSEEQTYRETRRGIQSYMGWTHISDIDSSTATSDDNPFAGPKLQAPGKVFNRLR